MLRLRVRILRRAGAGEDVTPAGEDTTAAPSEDMVATLQGDRVEELAAERASRTVHQAANCKKWSRSFDAARLQTSEGTGHPQQQKTLNSPASHSHFTHTHLLPVPTPSDSSQLVAHMGRVPGSGGPGWYAARAAFGLFAWELVHKQARMVGASTAPGSLPKLIALSPSVVRRLAAAPRSQGTGSGAGAAVGEAESAWLSALRGLVQVAALTGRMFVWPDPPCNASWLPPTQGSGGGAALMRLPLRPNPKALPYGSLSDLRCFPHEYLSQQCLHVFSSTWVRSPWVGGRGGGHLMDGPFRGMPECEARHVQELAGGKWGEEGGSDGGGSSTVFVRRGGAAAAAAAEAHRHGQGSDTAKPKPWWDTSSGITTAERGAQGSEEGGGLTGGEGADGASPISAVLAADVLHAVGGTADGYGSRNDGHVVLFLGNAVVVEDLPTQLSRKVLELVGRCPVFSKGAA